MNVQIQSVKFDADKKLIEFVENKMSKLERFADRATGAEVILKLDKDFEKVTASGSCASARSKASTVSCGEKSGAAATMTSAPSACSGRVTALCS